MKLKKNIIIGGSIILLTCLIIIGDYLALFGTRVEQNTDFIELKFKPVDEETGAPVFDVHARCYQKGNHNACSELDNGTTGIVTIKVPLISIKTSTFFFQKDISYLDTADPRLHVMLLHYDYANPVETFTVKELPGLAGKVIKVSMPKSMATQ